MNERIRELVNKAGFSFKYKTAPDELNPGHKLQDLEKFADIIIHECIKVVDSMADPDDSELYFWAIENCSEKIKKHFYE